MSLREQYLCRCLKRPRTHWIDSCPLFGRPLKPLSCPLGPFGAYWGLWVGVVFFRGGSYQFSDINIAYEEPGSGKDRLPDCRVWDRAVDAPEFYKDDALEQGYTIPHARSTASYRMYKPIEEVSHAGAKQDRTTGEPAYWRGRRRLRSLCGPIPDSGPASWIVCFPVALWRRTKSLEEHNNALPAECWVCPKISTPATCAGCESRADTRAGSSCGSPNVCKPMAFWTPFRCCGQLPYVLLGLRYPHPREDPKGRTPQIWTRIHL